ncbi:MAG TPA: NAD(P)/FAD-dependent oxidoreductase [Spirochaetia bacterium]|nr:NAD(P)/FAD-dependent oxidoreductase [Spirochaetia bacterium]HRZ63577.1 NAD(P)/FAD-dependent oxidoreductase [Spirochaetia bacterium]
MVYELAIIGAGAVGALLAREASRAGLKVLVLEAEADVASGSSKANSAIVHGGYAEGPETLKGRLCAQGRARFPELERELGFGFRPIGSLVLARDLPEDRARLEALLARGLANGLRDLRIVEGPELRELEPAASPEYGLALYCAGAGICSPWDLAIAALEAAIGRGAELELRRPVEAVRRIPSGEAPGGGFWELEAGGFAYRALAVANAAGLGAEGLDRLAGLEPPRTGARNGQYIVLDRGTGGLVGHVLFQLPGPLGKGILVTPTYQGNLLVGPDAKELEAAEDPAAMLGSDAERLGRIFESARRVVPSLSLERAIRSFTGLRCAAEDGDFHVGEAEPERAPGWFHALGIQSPGLTASPAIASLLAGQAAAYLGRGPSAAGPGLEEDAPRRPLPPHLSRRPERLPPEAAKAAAALPPGECERLVCRCEQVREREIAECLDREPRCATLDGIKRRSRAGMGSCQGQFCRPRVIEFAQRQLGRELDGRERLRDLEALAAAGRPVARLSGPELRKLGRELEGRG